MKKKLSAWEKLPLKKVISCLGRNTMMVFFPKRGNHFLQWKLHLKERICSPLNGGQITEVYPYRLKVTNYSFADKNFKQLGEG